MAAHGLTIAKQVLEALASPRPDEAKFAYAEAALSAPGWDLGASDPGAGYHDVHRGVRQSDLGQVLKGALAIRDRLKSLERYRTLEEAKAAYDAYVGAVDPTSSEGEWSRRRQQWFAGAAAAHGGAS